MRRRTAKDRLQLRSTITDAIMMRVEDELGSVLATLPSDAPLEVFRTIRNEVLPHTRFICEALTLAELQNEDALQVHIDNARQTAEYLVHRYMATRKDEE